MKTRVTDFLLYRWRYVIGYTVIIVAVSIVIAIASLYVPGSLRQAEIDSSLQSGVLSIESWSPETVIDLPYHVLQRLSFLTFGVSTLSIKLPSIVLGVLTSAGVFLLIRTWFRRNVAVITTILASTTAQFLFLIQDGTPAIMFSFLTIWILFAATYVTRKKAFGTFWKVLTGVLMAAAIYTPLGVYLVLAVLTTIFFHPHIRHIIKRSAKSRLTIATLFAITAITPVIYASVLDYHVALQLAGIANGQLDLVANFKQASLDLFGFSSQSTSHIIRPVYSLGLLLFMMVGIYKLLTYKYTARSYITLILGIMMVPLIIVNPEHIAQLFPLAVLMIALGIATLITDWYKLFPRNPYARVAGLIPLSILVGGIVVTGVLRYMNNYEYNPAILSHFSSDLRLLKDQLRYRHATVATTRVVTSSSERPFYDLVAHYDRRFTADETETNAPSLVIMTRAAHAALQPTNEPALIVTNRFGEDADRFYIYQK